MHGCDIIAVSSISLSVILFIQSICLVLPFRREIEVMLMVLDSNGVAAAWLTTPMEPFQDIVVKGVCHHLKLKLH